MLQHGAIPTSEYRPVLVREPRHLVPRASVNLLESRPVRGKRAHRENEADILHYRDPRTRALSALPEG
jgi:hypothetical protein